MKVICIKNDNNIERCKSHPFTIDKIYECVKFDYNDYHEFFWINDNNNNICYESKTNFKLLEDYRNEIIDMVL